MNNQVKIPFKKPFVTLDQGKQLFRLSGTEQYAGDGKFTQEVQSKLEAYSEAPKVLFMTSCTHALEMTALLLNIKPGDEVIMPSFTFVSTANPFALRGAKIVFVDVDPLTMNIDPKLVLHAITKKTVAIVPVHYGGVACDMHALQAICQQHQIYLIEDAAQGLGAYHIDHENKNSEKALGTLSTVGSFSFHDTKNIHCGEGGALVINEEQLIHRAEIIREKGTNRTDYLQGKVDKYRWVSLGSSYLPSELIALFLLAQLPHIEEVSNQRLALWQRYYQQLLPIQKTGRIELQAVPAYARHNGHLFYLKCASAGERSKLRAYLTEKGVETATHYIPLHSAPAGEVYGRFSGEDKHTTSGSQRLLRLPLYYDLASHEVDQICALIDAFYR